MMLRIFRKSTDNRLSPRRVDMIYAIICLEAYMLYITNVMFRKFKNISKYNRVIEDLFLTSHNKSYSIYADIRYLG